MRGLGGSCVKCLVIVLREAAAFECVTPLFIRPHSVHASRERRFVTTRLCNRYVYMYAWT